MMVSLCHGNQGMQTNTELLHDILIRASGIMPFFPSNCAFFWANYALFFGKNFYVSN